MTRSKVDFDDKGFKKMAEALSNRYYVEIGIQGDEAVTKHNDTNMTNAQIGSIHEFGSISRNIPRRSFLQDPLQEEFSEWVKKEKVNERFLECVAKNKIKDFFVTMSVLAEKTVNDCFLTSNKGRWKKLKPATIARRKNGDERPLIDTGQLRRSITSVVRKEKQ